MKKTELLFNLISIPVDAISLLCAGIASFYLRQKTTTIVGPIIYQLEINSFLSVVYKIILFLIILFALLGLYNLKGTRKFISELGRIVVGESLGLLLVILLFFFNQNIFPSRFIILATWGLGIVFVICGRLILKLFQTFLFAKNIGLHKLIVIKGGVEQPVIESVYKNRRNGYEIVAELPVNEKLLEKLEEFYNRGQIDEILQTNAGLGDADNLKLVQFARGKGLKFSFVPNLFEVQRNIIETESVNGLPVISLKNTPLDGWGKVIKRILDVVVSFVCLLLTSPLFLIITIAIKLDSKGKAIYSALRGGRGKDFRFYKFRSMYQHLSVGKEYGGENAEKIRQELWHKNDRGGENGPFLKIKDDPRVTKVGKFLRRSKLDEIPQFWNVLKGDMSMVGPRAHVLDEVERYRNRYPRMFSIKPGIFGLSQIAQVSWPDLPFEEEIRLNTFYIENWSVWLDIKILAKTFWLLFFAKKPKTDY
ncbi:MAG: sugar transferase [Candidatus Doudnabacteria bacterium]|nr:sugar transferase [Candidatus Doudnabacteria bacterium]